MDDLSRKIDPDYFRSCCRVSAANTKGAGHLAFLRHLSAWIHDRAHKGSFKPQASEAPEKQYIEEIIKTVEESKIGDFDPRAILMECLNDQGQLP